MTGVGDRIGCVTVLEVLEAAQARERDLRGYRGSPVHPKANGAQVWVRCDCLLEFLVRAREVTRRKNAVRCGKRCELGRAAAGRDVPEWTKCRNPLCMKSLRRDNTTGFCRRCQQEYPGKRWYMRTRPDFERNRARAVALDLAAKKGRRKQGLCVVCREPSPGRWRCPKCLERHRYWQQRHRDVARRAAA